MRNLLNHTTGISGIDGERYWFSQQGLEGTVRGYKTIQLTQPEGLSDGHYYMFGHAFRVERFKPPADLPSGGLIVGVDDMTHYAIAQLNEGRYGDTSILSPLGSCPTCQYQRF